jgi:hypothetical protein
MSAVNNLPGLTKHETRIEAELDKLTPLSNKQLLAMLIESVAAITRHTLRAAVCVRVLEARGEDLSDLADLRLLLPMLRKVAYGQLIPELLARVGAGHRIKVFAQLPIPDQTRLAAGEMVEVVVPGTHGERWDVRMMAVESMSWTLTQQVFAADGHIRTVPEQIALRESTEADRRPAPPTPPPVIHDPKRGAFKVGKNWVSRGQVVKALADNKPALTEEEASVSVTVTMKLTPSEAERLDHDAKCAKLHRNAYIPRAMRLAGIL